MAANVSAIDWVTGSDGSGGHKSRLDTSTIHAKEHMTDLDRRRKEKKASPDSRGNKFFLSLIMLWTFFAFFFLVPSLICTWWADCPEWWSKLQGTFQYVLAILVLITLVLRFPFIFLFNKKHVRNQPTINESTLPKVSILVPVKNEEEVIYDVIRTVWESDYPRDRLEVICINDGSDDRTPQEVRRFLRDFEHTWSLNSFSRVRFLDFPYNQGKRLALLSGLRVSRGSIIITMDSDTFMKRDAIKVLVGMMEPEDVAACGETKISNKRESLITRLQHWEYFVSFNIEKAFESSFGCVTCLPGCFSAYRKDVLLKVVPDWHDELVKGFVCGYGEDRYLTNLLLRHGNVSYYPEAGVHTMVPVTLSQLLRQRMRWIKSWFLSCVFIFYFIHHRSLFVAMCMWVQFMSLLLAPVWIIFMCFWPFVPMLEGTLLLLLVINLAVYFLTQYLVALWHLKPPSVLIVGFCYVFFFIFVMAWEVPVAIFQLSKNTWSTRKGAAAHREPFAVVHQNINDLDREMAAFTQPDASGNRLASLGSFNSNLSQGVTLPLVAAAPRPVNNSDLPALSRGSSFPSTTPVPSTMNVYPQQQTYHACTGPDVGFMKTVAVGTPADLTSASAQVSDRWRPLSAHSTGTLSLHCDDMASTQYSESCAASALRSNASSQCKTSVVRPQAFRPVSSPTLQMPSSADPSSRIGVHTAEQLVSVPPPTPATSHYAPSERGGSGGGGSGGGGSRPPSVLSNLSIDEIDYLIDSLQAKAVVPVAASESHRGGSTVMEMRRQSRPASVTSNISSMSNITSVVKNLTLDEINALIQNLHGKTRPEAPPTTPSVSEERPHSGMHAAQLLNFEGGEGGDSHSIHQSEGGISLVAEGYVKKTRKILFVPAIQFRGTEGERWRRPPITDEWEEILDEEDKQKWIAIIRDDFGDEWESLEISMQCRLYVQLCDRGLYLRFDTL